MKKFQGLFLLVLALMLATCAAYAEGGDLLKDIRDRGEIIVATEGAWTPWTYTRLGHVTDLTGWAEALGHGDVSVTFSLDPQINSAR